MVRLLARYLLASQRPGRFNDHGIPDHVIYVDVPCFVRLRD